MGKEQDHTVVWQCAQKLMSTSHPGSAVPGCPEGGSLELGLDRWSLGRDLMKLRPPNQIFSTRADHDICTMKGQVI